MRRALPKVQTVPRRRCCLLFFAVALASAQSGNAGFNYQLPDSTAMITAVAVDAGGNTYLTGSTTSPTFPATPGAFQTQYGGGTCPMPLGFVTLSPPCPDAFAIKLNPMGTVVWATYLGGSGADEGSAIAVDAGGNVYIAGGTASSNFPVTAGAAFPTLPGMPNVTAGFVVKLNAAGSQMIYGTYLPAMAAGLALDASGSAYAAGSADHPSSPFPTTAGAFQTASIADETGLIVKLAPDGSSMAYATFLGGNSSNESITALTGIAVDSSGNAVVTGYNNLGDLPVTAGAFQPKGSGTFAAKLNAAGSALVYSTFLGGGGDIAAVKVDGQGRAYVLTETAPGYGPQATAGAFEPTQTLLPPWAPGGINSEFLAALSADGTSMLYGTYITGAAALDVDMSGDAYVAGKIWGGFPTTDGAFERCPMGLVDGFAAEFSPTGAPMGATYLDLADLGLGGVTQSANAIAVAPGGMVSIASATGQGEFVTSLPIDNPQQQDGPCLSPAPLNAASHTNQGAIAPGEAVTLYGGGFGPGTGVNAPTTNGMLPTQLSGVQVLFDGVPAPILYVQSQQINAQAPWELAGKTSTQIQVVYNGTPTNTISAMVGPAAPGLFYLNSTTQQGAILNQDGTINSLTNPAHAGDVISVFGTGGGPISPPGITGGYWGSGANALLTLPASAQVNGVDAPVLYAGAAPGLLTFFFQVNVQIPAGIPAQPTAFITLTIGGGDCAVAFAVD
jgi:uncharacterized protein (TIGR03437 family)